MEKNDKPQLRVKFYKTPNGNEPVREWLKSQTKDVKKIVGEDIRAAQKVWPQGMPLVKHVESKIWEVRSTIPRGIVRVLFTVRNECIVLLHSFIKKTQKTPQQELEIARKRLKEWVD
jgi:phage-related protein